MSATEAPVPGIPPHPATFSGPILGEIGGLIEYETQRLGRSVKVLDPFAGVGGVHALGRQGEQLGFAAWWYTDCDEDPDAIFGPGHDIETVGVELEPEWARAHPRTIIGDATALPFGDACFDVVATSCTYGNRMADHHNARDGSTRITYTHKLGRPLTPGNSGAMQWGEPYRELHVRAWGEVRRVLRPDGLLLLNVSNHIRKGAEVPVVEWHAETLVGLGFIVKDDVLVPTARMRFGANGAARVGCEHIIVARRP
jgi:SAM-dependent methyltransferase